MGSNAHPPYTCQDYRDEMRLLSLRRQLAGPDLPESEKQSIAAAIRELERRLGLA